MALIGLLAETVLPYPTWLNPGDNAWQLTAATLVGLMSVPGLVVLYGGVMQKRWSVNSMMLAFSAFAAVLIVWVLYAFNMGFGNPWHGLSNNTVELLRELHRAAGAGAQPHRPPGAGDDPAGRAGRPGTSRNPRSSTSSSCSPRSRRS